MRYCFHGALLATILIVSFTTMVSAAPPRKKVLVYPSQGQAAYRHEERSKSQKQAIQAFLAHGVAQALASVSGSSRMSEATRAVNERILKQPERYVESFRVNSEGPSKGVYRVSGLVTVNIDSLKKDLSAQPPKPTQAPTASSKPPSDSGKPVLPSPSVAREKPQEKPPSSRGVIPSKPSLYWAVTEKLSDQWIPPGRDGGGQSPFFRYLYQETEDYGWTLSLPEPGELRPDSEGRIPVDRVVALATHAGSRIAVAGRITASSNQNQSQEISIAADLQLLEASSGKLLGDVRKETLTESGSFQEAMMGLAGQVAAQLDHTLQQDQTVPAKAQGPTARSTPARPTDGSWVLNIQGEGHYAAWEGLLNALRQRFSDLHIISVDLDGDKTKVVVEGIDDSLFTSTQEAPTLRDLRISVERLSTEPRQIELSVSSGSAAAGAVMGPQP
ncbi:MAG: hypothetical protein AB9873_00425 [Syntrophobacteraceae bacterium]